MHQSQALGPTADRCALGELASATPQGGPEQDQRQTFSRGSGWFGQLASASWLFYPAWSALWASWDQFISGLLQAGACWLSKVCGSLWHAAVTPPDPAAVAVPQTEVSLCADGGFSFPSHQPELSLPLAPAQLNINEGRWTLYNLAGKSGSQSFRKNLPVLLPLCNNARLHHTVYSYNRL